MSRRFLSAISGLVLVSAAASAAYAQPRIPGSQPPAQQPQQPAQTGGMLTSISADQTLKLLQEVGFKDLTFHQGQGGTRHVKGTVGQIDVYVIHANCEGTQCKSLAFSVFLGQQQAIDWNYINAWHLSWRFSRLFRDKEGALVFTMDVPFLGGVTPEYVKQSSIMFVQLLNTLLQFKPSQ